MKKGATPKGREAIVNFSGISHDLVLHWANFVDLHQIKGVGSEFSELLVKTGVETVGELSKRVPENPAGKMAGIIQAKKLVRWMPTLKEAKAWIAQAKKLPRVIPD